MLPVKDNALGVMLILVTASIVLGRLLSGNDAFHGENDRSRWATVRALGDNGRYAIGRRTDCDGHPTDVGIIAESGWTTIDKVLRPDTQEFYSSKPPLFPTLLAGLYLILKTATGLTLTDDTWLVARIILIITNLLPFVIYLEVLRRLFNRLALTNWAKAYLMFCACFATYVTTFSLTLNNHTPAALCTLFAIAPALKSLSALDRLSWQQQACCGFFGGMAACMELPAIFFTAGLWIAFLRIDRRRTLLLFTPAMAIPLAALVVCNVLSLGQVWPAYFMTSTVWYQFDGAAWGRGVRAGIDGASGYESKVEYIFHFLIGHHGLFSLSPVLAFAFCPDKSPAPPVGTQPQFAECVGKETFTSDGILSAHDTSLLRRIRMWTFFLLVLLVILYAVRTGNYGGATSGFRWLFWLTPLFLISMIPTVDRLAVCRDGRMLAYAFLTISVFSANYRSLNPWSHSWLYDFMKAMGWIPY